MNDFERENLQGITTPIKSVQIISNNLCYGPMPDEYDEIEQHLTIRADGKYWLTRYDYGDGPGKYRLTKKIQGQMYPGKVDGIFDRLKDLYRVDPITFCVTDCGDWKIKTTLEDGTIMPFGGSLANLHPIQSEISQMIRIELDMYDLFLLDGNTSEPRFEQGPIPTFRKYLPLLYENTFLWNRFSELCHDFFHKENRDEKFFAYHRDPACIQTWRGLLNNMGGGIPVHFFSAAAFIILAYKNAGNDIDAELAKIEPQSLPDEDDM